MKIENLKHLKQLIQFCLKNGVEAIEVDNIKMNLNLNHKPTPKSKARIQDKVLAPGGITDDTKIHMPDELTPEQLLFYSSTGHEPTETQ